MEKTGVGDQKAGAASDVATIEAGNPLPAGILLECGPRQEFLRSSMAAMGESAMSGAGIAGGVQQAGMIEFVGDDQVGRAGKCGLMPRDSP